MNIEVVGAALLIGLLGAGHCFGMCGGISSALTFAIDKQDWPRRTGIIFAYNVGRIVSYIVIGVGFATLAGLVQDMGFPYFRIVAGLLMVLMGLYISGLWRILTWLEHGGKIVWRHIQPLGTRLMPVKNVHSAFFLGAVWGWLPCGLVYTALVFSASQANMLAAAIVMLAFGLGTLPAVISGGLMADAFKQILQGEWFRNTSAVAMVLFGVWTIYGSVAHLNHGEHNNHSEHHAQKKEATERASGSGQTNHQHH